MSRRANVEKTEHGHTAKGEGWYVLNVGEGDWWKTDHFGSFCRLEGDVPFEHFSLNVRVLAPGQPACHYHRESQQEGFLVLHGECLVLIDGEERALRQWDYVHCPPETDHVFVGAGTGPCAILMIGARTEDAKIFYPATDLARKHDASAPEDTSSPKESYEGRRGREQAPSPWPPA